MILIVLWLICGIIAAAIGDNKGHGCLGAILGFVLGPIGILITYVLPNDNIPPEATKKCPFCAEAIMREAKVCKHCGRDLPEPPFIPAPPVPEPPKPGGIIGKIQDALKDAEKSRHERKF